VIIISEAYFSLRRSITSNFKKEYTDHATNNVSDSATNYAVNNTTDQVKTKKQIYDEFKEKMKEMLDPCHGMSEEDKAKYEEKINAKIKNGEKLSETEMRYIQLKSPYMYAQIKRVQLQRQALEDKLKNCHSKEEVEEAYNFSVSHINKDDPAKVPLLAAYDNVTGEFKKSGEYKSLPQKTKDEDKKNILPVTENSREEEFKMMSKYSPVEEDYSFINIRA
jgi:hypothetical protein